MRLLTVTIKLESGPFLTLVRSGGSSVGVVRSDLMILVRIDVQQDLKLGSIISKLLQSCSIGEVVANVEGWLC